MIPAPSVFKRLFGGARGGATVDARSSPSWGEAAAAQPSEVDRARGLYLALMEKCLVNSIYEDPPMSLWTGKTYDPAHRTAGVDWPSVAHSMIGAKRMFNLRCLCEYAVTNRIPGDFIETGVWRGGASIMMRAVLKAYQVTNRTVWLADSFAGLPPPDVEKFPADAGDNLHQASELAVSLATVKHE